MMSGIILSLELRQSTSTRLKDAGEEAVGIELEAVSLEVIHLQQLTPEVQTHGISDVYCVGCRHWVSADIAQCKVGHSSSPIMLD